MTDEIRVRAERIVRYEPVCTRLDPPLEPAAASFVFATPDGLGRDGPLMVVCLAARFLTSAAEARLSHQKRGSCDPSGAFGAKGLLEAVRDAPPSEVVEHAAQYALSVAVSPNVRDVAGARQFYARLEQHADAFFKDAQRVQAICCFEAALRILPLLFTAPDLRLLSHTVSGGFLDALRAVRDSDGPVLDAESWMLAAARASRSFATARHLAAELALWPPTPPTRDGVTRLAHCVVALKWAAERDRELTADDTGLPALTGAPPPTRRVRNPDAGPTARRPPPNQRPRTTVDRAAWRKDVSGLLTAVGLSATCVLEEFERDDTFEDAFLKSVYGTRMSFAELRTKLLDFAAARPRPGRRLPRGWAKAAPMTRGELGLDGVTDRPATADDYATALDRFVATLNDARKLEALAPKPAAAPAAAADAADNDGDDDDDATDDDGPLPRRRARSTPAPDANAKLQPATPASP